MFWQSSSSSSSTTETTETPNVLRLNKLFASASATTAASYDGGRVLAACTLLVCEKLDAIIAALSLRTEIKP